MIGYNNIIIYFFNVAAHISFKNAYIRIFISNFHNFPIDSSNTVFQLFVIFYAKHTYAYTHIAAAVTCLKLSFAILLL